MVECAQIDGWMFDFLWGISIYLLHISYSHENQLGGSKSNLYLVIGIY